MVNQKQKKQKRSAKSTRVWTDIPPPAKRTTTTMSCPYPVATDRVVIHSTAAAVLAATPTAPVANSYNFNFASSNASTGNFDQYRLMAVRVSIVPQNNAIGLVTNSTTLLAPLYCVIDFDDAATLSSASQALGYTNCCVVNPGESLSRTFKPRMALGAYSGAFTGFANVEPQWIDAVSTSVQHYGIKIYIPGVAAAQTLLQTWDLIFEYAWELRAVIT